MICIYCHSNRTLCVCVWVFVCDSSTFFKCKPRKVFHAFLEFFFELLFPRFGSLRFRPRWNRNWVEFSEAAAFYALFLAVSLNIEQTLELSLQSFRGRLQSCVQFAFNLPQFRLLLPLCLQVFVLARIRFIACPSSFGGCSKNGFLHFLVLNLSFTFFLFFGFGFGSLTATLWLWLRFDCGTRCRQTFATCCMAIQRGTWQQRKVWEETCCLFSSLILDSLYALINNSRPSNKRPFKLVFCLSSKKKQRK